MTKFLETLHTILEVFGFLWAKKLWWAFPVVLMLFLFTFVIFLGQATPMGPFIYALF